MCLCFKSRIGYIRAGHLKIRDSVKVGYILKISVFIF